MVELLISVIVLMVVGSVVVNIITTVFRGNTKATAVNNIRQSGVNAIIQMGRAIGYAKSFDGVSLDGISFTANCVVSIPAYPNPTPTPIQYQYLKITSFDSGKTIFSCPGTTIASNSASLLDQSSVNLTSCYFTCIADKVSDHPIIGINFALSQKGSGLIEDAVSVPFSTSVTVRNLRR